MPTEPHGYETADARVPAIVRWAGVLVIIVLLALVLGRWLVGGGGFDTEAAHAVAPPLAERRIPPPPRLQPAPALDLEQLHRWEDEQLQRYGWVEKRLGRVRIPIDRAMELVVEGARPPEGAPASEGTP